MSRLAVMLGLISGLMVSLLLSYSAALAESLVPAKLEDRSPREEIRKKIFPQGSPDRSCQILSRDPKGTVEVDPGLTAFIQSLIKSINSGDAKTLQTLFHPQLKVKSPQVKAAITSIQRISGDKIDATMFRAYGINSFDGVTTAIPCPEDGLLVHPLFSHPFQAGVWIQATGAEEVTRVYVVLIPTKDKWMIGAWHVQQWTHAGKDFTVWRQEAESLSAKNQQLAAWVYLDIAGKLLDGGKFLVLPVSEDIAKEKQKAMPIKSLKDQLAPKFKDDKLVYASSLFSRKGAAILLRFSIPGEMSAVAIRDHCKSKYKELSAEAWMTSISGIRCDYVLPRESIDKEGALGGIFIDRI